MKWSRYNTLFYSEKVGYCLFNSRMLSFTQLDKRTFDILSMVKENIYIAPDVISDEDINSLKEKKIIVSDTEDDKYLDMLKYKKNVESYTSRSLSLVVCPTLSCNLACPYCYEHNLPKSVMNSQTQNELMEFINVNSLGMESLTLCWHGGEPLMAFDTIKQIYSLIEKKVELPIRRSSMVSNGYLLNKEMCLFLERKGLDYLQITIDGNRETHNKTRKLKNGNSSFEKILENIDMATELMPNCQIGIRTNIGKGNREEYAELYFELTKRWAGKNCTVYHTYVLGIKYMTIILGNDNYCRVNTDNIIYADGDLYDNVTSDQHRESQGKPQHNLNAYYKGKAGNTAIDLNADYFRNDWTVLYPVNEQSNIYTSDGFNIHSSEISSMVAIKLSLNTPIHSGILNYGGEFIELQRRNIYESSRTDIIDSSHEKLSENTTSLYAEYGHPTPIGYLTFGVRYEHVGVKYYDESTYIEEKSHTYDNLFPNVRLTTNLGKTKWQFYYSIKTERPTFQELSSNTSYNNRYLLQQGNSSLKNQTDHIVEFSGVWRFIQLSLGYTDSRNAIVQWANHTEGHENVLHISWKNLPSIKRIYTSISAKPEVGFWAPQFSVSLYKQWLTLQTHIGTHHLNKPMFNADISNNISIPLGIILNVDFSYKGKGHQWNYETIKNRYLLNIGLKKSFISDALTFRIWGNDILHHNKRVYMSYYNVAQQFSSITNGSREIVFTVSYTFNQTSSKYKGVSAGSSVRKRL